MNKIKQIFSFLMVFGVLLTFLFVSMPKLSADEISKTDSSLGIFRDLTSEEIKAYYSDLQTGDKGDALLTKLQDILKKDQVKLNYNSGSTSSTAWDGYYLLDRDWSMSPLTEEEVRTQKYSKTGIWMNILYASQSIYLNDKINAGTFSYYDDSNTYQTVNYKNGGAQFDREHVLPKSYGFNLDGDGYKDLTAGCDMQNLHAGEHYGNSLGHNNYPYGTVVNKTKDTEIASAITGEIIGYTGLNKDGIKVFEPLDCDKGDIARTVFYMCARYHYFEDLGGGDLTPAITLSNAAVSSTTMTPLETKTSPAVTGELDDLLAWNELDPVDEFEIHRNNLCYNAIQKNRNPFVDYPEWVNVCFDSSSEIGIDLSQEDGIQPKFGLKAVSNVNEIYTKSNFKETDFTFTYTDKDSNTITLSSVDLTFEVYLNNTKLDDVTDLYNYVFKKPGEYKVKFNYHNPVDDTDYKSTYSFTVINTYKLENSYKDEIAVIEYGKSLNLSALTLTLFEKGVDKGVYEGTYDVTIYDESGKAISSNKDYAFKSFSKYKVEIKGIYDEEELITSFEVQIVPNLIQKIIAGVIIAILIIVVLIFVLNNQKKKKSKSKVKSKAKSTAKKTVKKAVKKTVAKKASGK